MGSGFSFFENEDVDMSPVLRKRNEDADINSMTPATVKKELKRRGIEVEALLREKLKELRDAEVSAAGGPSNARPMETEAATAPASPPLALPVPVVRPKAGGPLTRSQLTEATEMKRPANRAIAAQRAALKNKMSSAKKASTSGRKKRRRRTGKWTVKKQRVVRKRTAPAGGCPADDRRGHIDDSVFLDLGGEIDETDYDVEMILDVRGVDKSEISKREFLIRWTGYGEEEDQWIEETNLALPIDEYKQSDVAKTKLQADYPTGSS